MLPDAVSRALQLDEAERAHLLDLVRIANVERAPRQSTPISRQSGGIAASAPRQHSVSPLPAIGASVKPAKPSSS